MLLQTIKKKNNNIFDEDTKCYNLNNKLQTTNTQHTSVK